MYSYYWLGKLTCVSILVFVFHYGKLNLLGSFFLKLLNSRALNVLFFQYMFFFFVITCDCCAVLHCDCTKGNHHEILQNDKTSAKFRSERSKDRSFSALQLTSLWQKVVILVINMSNYCLLPCS